MYKIFFTAFVILFSLCTTAQETKKNKREIKKERINALIKQEEEGVIAYRKHTVYGLKLTNDGYGFFMEVGRGQSVNKSLLFQLDFAERKHPKEDKQTNPFFPSTPFIFGKINFFYPLKLGLQQQIVLGNKTNKNGVSVTGNFGGGISLGLLRPYMLDVTDTATGGRKNIKYDGPDSTLFTNSNELVSLNVGGPRFGTGWGSMKLTPGAYAKAALRFDYGRYNEMVNALEVGITAEVYSKKVQQLVFVKPKRLFFNAYVAIMFGRRK